MDDVRLSMAMKRVTPSSNVHPDMTILANVMRRNNDATNTQMMLADKISHHDVLACVLTALLT
jgi:hypothetical protein